MSKMRSFLTNRCLRMSACCLLLVQLALGQSYCDRAPTSTLRRICEEKGRMYEEAEKDKNCCLDRSRCTEEENHETCTASGAGGAGIPEFCHGKVAFLTLKDCSDLGCVCSFIDNAHCNNVTKQCELESGAILTKSARKEYRMLSDEERERFHRVLTILKNNGVYEKHVRDHTAVANSGGAHSGPGFLGWHRHFINSLELELHAIDPNVALPYWDSTLDSNIPDPAESMLWTDELVGGTDGSGWVISGAFAGWRTADGGALNRRLGADREARLFRQSDIEYLMRQTGTEKFLAFTTPQCTTDFTELEYTHDQIHKYVGGHMGEPTISANDPIFFLHHAFVDFIWELWRQQRQTPDERRRASTRKTMLGVLHGITFERYLFCDRSHGTPRCASKVRLGGSCLGFSAGEDVCYNGQCQCVSQQNGQQECRCMAISSSIRKPDHLPNALAELEKLVVFLEEVYRKMQDDPDFYRYIRGTIAAAVQKSLPQATERQRTLLADPVTRSLFGRYVAVLEALRRYIANYA